MLKKKQSFFERLTGTINVENDEEEKIKSEKEKSWVEEEDEAEQLAVDVYNTSDEIVIQTMVAGVDPDNLDISISREMVTIKGERKGPSGIPDENYYHRELYWGSFSRTILLPQEIETEEAEASEEHGLLTIKLPKIDKERQMKLKVKAR